jgi:hypothetical protein
MMSFILLYAVNFIRTLIILVIIYFAIRLIRRYVLPLLIDQGIKNMQQKMQEQQRRQQPRRPQGDVTIEYEQKNNKTNQNQGDYVDFEEVD